MMQIETKSETHGSRLKMGSTPPPPPPPLPPLPKFACTANPAIKRATVVSVTNQEIAMYWRQRSLVEEDHLLAAIKAAARIRARNLSEDDYRRFEESLKEDDDGKEKDTAESFSQKDEKIKELRVGIKDWWTKSKYAYLNQPVIESMDTPKRRASTYIPQFCCYMSAPPPATTNGNLLGM